MKGLKYSLIIYFVILIIHTIIHGFLELIPSVPILTFILLDFFILPGWIFRKLFVINLNPNILIGGMIIFISGLAFASYLHFVVSNPDHISHVPHNVLGDAFRLTAAMLLIIQVIIIIQIFRIKK